ncbi:hypothetical protein NEOLEDRAFT_1059010, partial [Neolentinus lepideus HHB14362 ss-1]
MISPATLDIAAPVLVGVEALALAPAETGRPETSKEFAKRIKRVRLNVRQPGQPQEGEAAGDTSSGPATENLGPDSFVEHVKAVQNEIGKTIGDENLPALVDQPEPDSDLLEYISDNEISLEVAIRNRYKEDPWFKQILEHSREYKNFDITEGLVYLRSDEHRLLCIPDIRVNGRSAREIVISHAHSLLAHLGYHKTLEFLRDHVWWK